MRKFMIVIFDNYENQAWKLLMSLDAVEQDVPQNHNPPPTASFQNEVGSKTAQQQHHSMK
jgi:hypothetical protein